jgi:hypothetical protein
MSDYPKVRAHHICPVCNGQKDEGLIACWTCFRNCGIKSGDMEHVIREREMQLSGIRRVEIGERAVKVEVAPDNPDATVDATVFLVSVWLGEMLDAGDIDQPTFKSMVREVYNWAVDLRTRAAVQ